MKNPNVHGDQYVTVQIQVPRHLNQQARRKLMEYKQACRIKRADRNNFKQLLLSAFLCTIHTKTDLMKQY